MNDQLPAGCVYLGQNQRGKVIHAYNGWAIQAIDTGADGYVAWRSQELPDHDCGELLVDALERILSRRPISA